MKIINITNYLNDFIPIKPKICLILGSGLSSFIDKLEKQTTIYYKDIPGFFTTSVAGHEGMFIHGFINDIPVLCANGRFHYYEGYTFEEVGSIIQIFSIYNPKLTIVTNSSGCLNLNWRLGDFMLVNKFLDFSFIDSYNPKIYKILKTEDYNSILKLAKQQNIRLNEGTYTYTIGPSYETSAEIDEIIHLKGDAVGMSTFPEFLMCNKTQLNTVFIACLTNYGAGLIKNKKINHQDVLKGAAKAKKDFCELITSTIENIGLQKTLMK